MTTYTAIAAGGDWNTNATWGGAGHPVAGDTANIDTTMTGTVTVSASGAACAIINCAGTTGTLLLNGNMSTTGNITLPDGVGSVFTPNGKTWTSYANVTIKSNGKSFYNLTCTGGGGSTLTLTDTLTCTNTFGAGASTGFTFITSDIYCKNLTNDGANNITSTRIIHMTGGGIWNHTSTGGSILANLTLEGATTITGPVHLGNGTFTALTGSGASITQTGTVFFNGSTTINDNTGQIGAIGIENNTTLTLSKDLTCVSITSNVGNNVSLTFVGAFNIICGTFAMVSTNAQTITLVGGQSLTVNTALTLYPGTYNTATNVTASSKAYITYNGPMSGMDIYKMVFTNISGENGSTLYNWYGGTLTGTTNITNADNSMIGGGGSAWIIGS